MRWWSLVVCLATAMAVPAVARAETTAAVTDRDIAQVAQLDHELATEVDARNKLDAQYKGQLANVDSLKHHPRSWSNDRKLNDAQAEANDTLQKLDASEAAIRATQAKLANADKDLVGAIDAELAAGTTDGRKQKLTALRTSVNPKPKKIVIPNSDLDDAADPEELEQKAAELKQAEAELAKEEDGLQKQASELDAVAKTRREHDRTQEVVQRDDDQPHRQTTAPHGSSGDHDSANAPTAGGAASSNGGGGTGSTQSTGAPSGQSTSTSGDRGYESDAQVVLQDVVDKGTLDSLKRVQSSNDPAQRAAVAQQAHDAVAARREQLRKKREAIEARAKQLRGKK